MPLKQQKSLRLTPWFAKLHMRPHKWAAVLNMCSRPVLLLLLVTFSLCKILCHSVLLLILHYTTVIMLIARSKVGQWEMTYTFRSHVNVSNFELVFPSRQVLVVDWLSLGWLMLVVLASYQHVLQTFSTAARLVRAHLEFCKSCRQTQYFVVLETLVF